MPWFRRDASLVLSAGTLPMSSTRLTSEYQSNNSRCSSMSMRCVLTDSNKLRGHTCTMWRKETHTYKTTYILLPIITIHPHRLSLTHTHRESHLILIHHSHRHELHTHTPHTHTLSLSPLPLSPLSLSHTHTHFSLCSTYHLQQSAT